MNLTTYTKNIIINHMLRGEAWTPPAQVYALLLDTSATDAQLDSNSEFFIGAAQWQTSVVQRMPLTFAAASGGTASNTNTHDLYEESTWNQQTGNLTVDHVLGIVTNETGGVFGGDVYLLMWKPIGAITHRAGVQLRIEPGNITVGFD